MEKIEPILWMQSNHLTTFEKLHSGSSMMLARCSHLKAMSDFQPLYSQAIVDQLVRERDRLRMEVTELREVNEGLEKERDEYEKDLNSYIIKAVIADMPMSEVEDSLKKQLAASEALLAKYREALEFECGNRCNAEYNPCNARAVLDSTPLPQAALNAAIADELERMAEGFMSDDPLCSGKNVQYYGSHIRGVLRNRAKELREQGK